MKIKFDDDCITIGDFNEAQVCIIWLHGYGANNWSFEPILKTVNLKLNEKTFIIVPNAPMVEGKRSWYPLPQLDSDNNLIEDCTGLMRSIIPIREMLHKLIYSSLEDSKKKHFLIGGFSQGGGLGLAMLCDPDTVIDGCISVAGYMPCADYFRDKTNMDDEKLFIAHGSKDEVITIQTHQQTMGFLKTLNIDIHETVSDFGHTVPAEIIEGIVNWVEKNYISKK